MKTEQEIRDEFIKIWEDAKGKSTHEGEYIADYWLNIRQEALTEQKMKFKEMVERNFEDWHTITDRTIVTDGFLKTEINLLSELTNL